MIRHIKLVLLLSVIYWNFNPIAAQEILRDHAFFRHLLRDSGIIYDITAVLHQNQKPYVRIPDIPSKLITHKTLVRNNKGLFLLLSGTGRVYQIKEEAGKLDMVRIDSTIFSGYNFSDYTFSYNDTLMSFGGQGYWRTNSHLRFYQEDKGEWELMRLNREFVYSGVALSMAQEKLYIWHDSVYAIDMNSRLTEKMGVLSAHSKKFSKHYFTTSPWGIIMYGQSQSQNDLFLYDFEANQIFKLKRKKSDIIFSLLNSNNKYYMSDSTFYINRNTELYAVHLSKNDFVLTDHQIYNPVKVPSKLASIGMNLEKNGLIILTLIIGVLIGFVLSGTYFKNKLAKQQSINVLTEAVKSTLFDEAEKMLIKFILINSKKRIPASAEAINRILGVTQKPPDIQKKHRSDILLSINKKFHYSTVSSGNLVISKRNKLDKRVFDYFIEEENYKEIQNIIE